MLQLYLICLTLYLVLWYAKVVGIYMQSSMNIELKKASETLMERDTKSQKLYLFEEHLNTKHQGLGLLHILIQNLPCYKRTKGAIFHLGLT